MTTTKKTMKILYILFATVFLCILLFYILVLASCSSTSAVTSESGYLEVLSKVERAERYMPSLDTLGSYQEITANFKGTKYVLWSPTNTVSLTVKYDATNFEKAKKAIQTQYDFLTESTAYLSDLYAEVEGYEVQIVDKTEGDIYFYPKCFLMIGVNEETCSIVYLFHSDADLDKIDDLDGYIKKYYTLPNISNMS